MAKESFNPRIVAFLCNWCSYASADLAGVSRFQYPTNIRIIRVMCSARVDPTWVVEAYLRGLDGVMVLGCHLGTCHYMTGNYYTEYRMKEVRRLLSVVGLNPSRLLVEWVSAAEAERFASLVRSFCEKIRGIGPLGVEGELLGDELCARLTAARNTFASDRIRWLVGKERELMESANVFGERLTQERFDGLMTSALQEEYVMNRILLSLTGKALPVREIAKDVGLVPRDVLKKLVSLEQTGQVSAEVAGGLPMYRRLGT